LRIGPWLRMPKVYVLLAVAVVGPPLFGSGVLSIRSLIAGGEADLGIWLSWLQSATAGVAFIVIVHALFLTTEALSVQREALKTLGTHTILKLSLEDITIGNIHPKSLYSLMAEALPGSGPAGPFTLHMWITYLDSTNVAFVPTQQLKPSMRDVENHTAPNLPGLIMSEWYISYSYPTIQPGAFVEIGSLTINPPGDVSLSGFLWGNGWGPEHTTFGVIPIRNENTEA
jgi:hypothetical protein